MRPALFLVPVLLLTGCAWFQAPGSPAGTTTALEDTRETLPPKKAAAEGEMCGGLAGFVCEEGLTCIYEDGACHSMADAAGTCMAVGPVCTKEYRPVCGCDGKTYGNKCEAYATGTSVAHSGECKAQDL